MDNRTIFILIVVGFFIWSILSKREKLETLENSQQKEQDVKNFIICKDCKAWNHRDASSKCEKQCKLQIPDRDTVFTGEWARLNDKDISCECSFRGKHTKEYVGCPVGATLDDNKSCFIWNDKDANELCQPICNKFLNNVHPKWTGNWKTTSAETSACECEYYG